MFTGAENRAKQREGTLQKSEDIDREMPNGGGNGYLETCEPPVPQQQAEPGRADEADLQAEEEQGEGADAEQEDAGTGLRPRHAPALRILLRAGQDRAGRPGRTGGRSRHLLDETLQCLLIVCSELVNM